MSQAINIKKNIQLLNKEINQLQTKEQVAQNFEKSAFSILAYLHSFISEISSLKESLSDRISEHDLKEILKINDANKPDRNFLSKTKTMLNLSNQVLSMNKKIPQIKNAQATLSQYVQIFSDLLSSRQFSFQQDFYQDIDSSSINEKSNKILEQQIFNDENQKSSEIINHENNSPNKQSPDATQQAQNENKDNTSSKPLNQDQLSETEIISSFWQCFSFANSELFKPSKTDLAYLDDRLTNGTISSSFYNSLYENQQSLIQEIASLKESLIISDEFASYPPLDIVRESSEFQRYRQSLFETLELQKCQQHFSEFKNICINFSNLIQEFSHYNGLHYTIDEYHKALAEDQKFFRIERISNLRKNFIDQVISNTTKFINFINLLSEERQFYEHLKQLLPSQPEEFQKEAIEKAKVLHEIDFNSEIENITNLIQDINTQRQQIEEQNNQREEQLNDLRAKLNKPVETFLKKNKKISQSLSDTFEKHMNLMQSLPLHVELPQLPADQILNVGTLYAECKWLSNKIDFLQQKIRDTKLEKKKLAEDIGEIKESVEKIKNDKAQGKMVSLKNEQILSIRQFFCPSCNVRQRDCVLPCGHTFCKECTNSFFENYQCCPICEVPFKKSSVIQMK